MLRKTLSTLAAVMLLAACSGGNSDKSDNTAQSGTTAQSDTTNTQTMQSTFNPADTSSVKVEVSTTAGNFTILLYGDTPRHRDNFVKLVNDGYYDNTLFHRVISEFMVQAGDPDSRTAAKGRQLGQGGPGYTVEAEILFPKHFHKRGALAAARTADQINPERRSSGSQFYIVTGKKVADAEIAGIESYMQQSQMQAVFNGLAAAQRDRIIAMQQQADTAGLRKLQDELIAQTEKTVAANPVKLTDEMRRAYTTIGGAPHLDNAYTVFGEVTEGMDVIDRIEKVETDRNDRPVDDVRILSMKIVK